MASSQACQHDSECKKDPITTCLGCLNSFCASHLLAHRQVLEAQFQDLFNERNSLCEALQNSARSCRASNVYQLIDQWEKEQTQQLHSTAAQARLITDRLLHEENNCIQGTYDQISVDLQEKFDRDSYNEIDIERFRLQLQHICTLLSKEEPFIFAAKPVGWNELLSVLPSEPQNEIEKEKVEKPLPLPDGELKLQKFLERKPRYEVIFDTHCTIPAVASDEG